MLVSANQRFGTSKRLFAPVGTESNLHLRRPPSGLLRRTATATSRQTSALQFLSCVSVRYLNICFIVSKIYTLSRLLHGYLPTGKKTSHNVSFSSLNRRQRHWTEHSLFFLFVVALFLCPSFSISSTSLLSKTLCRFSSPSSLLSSLYLFLTGDDNSAFCQEVKSLYFPRILKLMWNSSILVA